MKAGWQQSSNDHSLQNYGMEDGNDIKKILMNYSGKKIIKSMQGTTTMRSFVNFLINFFIILRPSADQYYWAWTGKLACTGLER